MKTYINDCISAISERLPSFKKEIESAVDSYFSRNVQAKTLCEKITYFFRSYFAKREATNILWNYRLYQAAKLYTGYVTQSQQTHYQQQNPKIYSLIKGANFEAIKQVTLSPRKGADHVRSVANIWERHAPRFSFFL
jgi:hypothetical protein